MIKRPIWLRATPSTYGQHALDPDGHCHTREPDEDYVGHHRQDGPAAAPSGPQTDEGRPPGMTG